MIAPPGGVAEWPKALVLKTSECNSSESSNLSPSAIPESAQYLQANQVAAHSVRISNQTA